MVRPHAENPRAIDARSRRWLRGQNIRRLSDARHLNPFGHFALDRETRLRPVTQSMADRVASVISDNRHTFPPAELELDRLRRLPRPKIPLPDDFSVRAN